MLKYAHAPIVSLSQVMVSLELLRGSEVESAKGCDSETSHNNDILNVGQQGKLLVYGASHACVRLPNHGYSWLVSLFPSFA